jgi:excisionase family DNA binding protein
MQGKLISYDDAAALLGLARGTLASMVHRRQIPHVRMGPRLVRFDQEELVAWWNERRVAVAKAAAQ